MAPKTLFSAVLLMIAPGAVRAAALPAELAAAAKAYDEAQLHGDGPALQRLLADDYLLVNSGGVTEGKAEFIKDLTDPNVKQDPFTIDKPVQRVWADGAVLGGVTTLAGTDKGVRFHLRIRFADVWARRGGAWQVVYTQVMKAKDGD